MARIDEMKEFFSFLRLILTIFSTLLFAIAGWLLHAIAYDATIAPIFYSAGGLICVLLIRWIYGVAMWPRN